MKPAPPVINRFISFDLSLPLPKLQGIFERRVRQPTDFHDRLTNSLETSITQLERGVLAATR